MHKVWQIILIFAQKIVILPGNSGKKENETDICIQ